MTVPNIERGDTFIVDEDKHRGNHFTCIAVRGGGFLAGDTTGSVWRFEPASGLRYQVSIDKGGAIWSHRGHIPAESIVKE